MVRSAGSSSESGLASGDRAAARRRPASRPSWSKTCVADERVVQRLDVAGAGQRAADPAAQPLRLGQAAAGRRLRQRGGQVLVALQPDDLLGEVVGVAEVGAPGRHGDDQLVAARRRRSRPAGGGVPRSRGRSRCPRPGRGGRRASAMVRGADGRDDLGDAGLGGAAREQHQQVDGALRGGRARPAGRCRARSAGTPRRTACGGARCGRSETASKCAASMTTSVVPVPRRSRVGAVGDLGVGAAHDARPGRSARESSVMTRSSASSVRSTPSRVVSFSPCCGAAHADRALRPGSRS